jgi:transposase
MPKKVTTTPKLFIGIDIHKKSWKIHFCTDITSGGTKTMPPDAHGLKQYIEKYFDSHQIYVAYEAGCCGYSAARSFATFGWDTYVVNAADIPRPAKQGVIKTDQIDARNIANQLKAGNLRKIVIPSIERECLRNLTRRRTQIVRRLRKIKGQIKSLLLYHNLSIPEQYDNPNWSKAFVAWLQDFQWNYQSIDLAFNSMMDELEFLLEQERKTSNGIRAYCRKHHYKDYNLLRSVPGIGPLNAAYIISEIGDIRRFNLFKNFASYVGLIPNVASSGENSSIYGVNPRANRTIRSLLVEAAWVAIRVDPVLQQYYRKHARHNCKAAIFKVAHKLLSRIHAVVKTNTEYQIGLIT